MLHAEQFCRFCCDAGFVEAFFVIAAGICTLGITHGKHVGRIHAAGEEGFSRFILGLDLAHHLLQGRVDLVCPVLQ